MKIALVAAAAVAVLAAGDAAVVSRDGFSLKLPPGWRESPALTAASQDRISQIVEGGAVAWEKKETGAIARVLWLRSKYPSGVRVREELEALHEVWKTEAEGGRVVSWDVDETKVLMTSKLTYRLGNTLEGKGKIVRQVAIAGVDRDGRIRAWTLECGFPSAAAAEDERDCETLASSFASTVPASRFRAIEPKGSPESPPAPAKDAPKGSK